MISIREIDDQIRAAIDDLVAKSSNGVPRNWVVGAVMKAHILPVFEDRDFYELCTREMLNARVRHIFNSQKKKEDEGGDPQLVLPGYEFLQARYAIVRGGVIQHVKIEHMSIDELEKRAQEYMKMGKSCIRHGKELMEYAKNLRLAAS